MRLTYLDFIMADIVKIPGRKPYYVRFTLGGKQVFRSTKTTDRNRALAFAKMLRNNAYNTTLLHPRLAKAVCTIAQIKEAYANATSLGKAKVRRCNFLQLLHVISPGEAEETILEKSAEVIVPALIVQHQAGGLKKKRPPVSINADIKQARAVFSKRAVAYYEKVCGLTLPKTLKDFLEVPYLPAENRGYDPIAPQVLAKIDAAIAEIKTKNFELWKVLTIARELGLRNHEIYSAKGSWIIPTAEGTAFSVINREGEFRTKNGVEREILVASELGEALAGTPAEKYLIAPEKLPTQRHNVIYRETAMFLRPFLPNRKKLLYELRKQAGSWVATNAPGHLYDAQAFLGHKSFATTERYYAKNLNRPKAACLHPARKEEK